MDTLEVDKKVFSYPNFHQDSLDTNSKNSIRKNNYRNIWNRCKKLLAIQFRKIIEEITLSSMVLHVDKYSQVREKFDKDWNAKVNCCQDLKRLNPEYFPKAVNIVESDPIKEQCVITKTPNDLGQYLTEIELLNIYEKGRKEISSHAFVIRTLNIKIKTKRNTRNNETLGI